MAFPLSDVYEPHQVQLEIHASDARWKVLCLPRRIGKTRFGVFELIYNWIEACTIPAPASLVPSWHAWMVVPAKPQARQIWNELRTFIPKDWLLRPPLESDWIIELKGRGTRRSGLIEVKSAYNVNSLQSVGLDYCSVHEAQDIHQNAFERLLPCLESPNRMKRAIFEGIPSLWPDHWFERMCVEAEAAMDDPNQNHYYYKTGLYSDNPMLSDEDKKVIESFRPIMGESQWSRMYEANRNVNAAYFKNVESCIEGYEMMAPVPGTRYVAGLDLGQKVDPSVMYVVDAKERRVHHRRTWDRQEDWTQQLEEVVNITDQWNIQNIRADASGVGAVFVQNMLDEGLPVEGVVFTKATKPDLLHTLMIAVERQTVTFPNIKPLLRQMKAHQPLMTAAGNTVIGVPRGEHDDEVDALALALSACDPPAAEISQVLRGVGRRRRYMPTQAEAEGRVGQTRHPVVARRRAERWKRRQSRDVALSGVEGR